MKIVIAGAGSVGFHLASLLAKEEQDITVIDTDEDVLYKIRRKLDVLTITGDATSPAILDEAEVAKSQLFLAVTTSEKTNLLAAILAKQKGSKKTIARVSNPEYLKDEQKDAFITMGVDKLMCPQQLAAKEIKRLLKKSPVTDLFEFEGGLLTILGLTIEENSKKCGKTVSEIFGTQHELDFRGVAILRDEETIIPKSHTQLLGGDHLYLSINSKYVDTVIALVGKQVKPIKKVMIVGDTPLALRTTKILEKEYAVNTLVPDKEVGKKFIQQLDRALITVADPGDGDSLIREGLDNMDAFISLTPNSEINILTSLIAEEHQVSKTIALVDNEIYTRVSQNIGIDTIINKKIIAANNIFRFVRKGKIAAIATLHGVDAEIIEFILHKDNQVTSKPLADLKIPASAIVAGVIRDDHCIIPDGTFVCSKMDKIIVLALPDAIKKVEELFK